MCVCVCLEVNSFFARWDNVLSLLLPRHRPLFVLVPLLSHPVLSYYTLLLSLSGSSCSLSPSVLPLAMCI